jgi:transposase-like protein
MSEMTEHVGAVVPCEPQGRVRTTNRGEGLNQKIKRRTRAAKITLNGGACLRPVTVLSAEQSEEWVTGRRYPDVEEPRERRREERHDEGVAPLERRGVPFWWKVRTFGA